MRRHTPAMLGLGSWRQRDLQIKANLNYIVRPVSKQINLREKVDKGMGWEEKEEDDVNKASISRTYAAGVSSGKPWIQRLFKTLPFLWPQAQKLVDWLHRQAHASRIISWCRGPSPMWTLHRLNIFSAQTHRSAFSSRASRVAFVCGRLCLYSSVHTEKEGWFLSQRLFWRRAECIRVAVWAFSREVKILKWGQERLPLPTLTQIQARYFWPFKHRHKQPHFGNYLFWLIKDGTHEVLTSVHNERSRQWCQRTDIAAQNSAWIWQLNQLKNLYQDGQCKGGSERRFPALMAKSSAAPSVYRARTSRWRDGG